jgi:hypothetical protein|tara:strand:+ start:495 stop:1364 length:870 start_codon:yes stop_codon:yes gene_type:complete
MKPEIFEASIEKGSNKLYVISNRQVGVRNGAFIKLGINDIFYRAENTETINLRRKFTAENKVLTIKGNYNYKLISGDSLKINYEEYEAVSVSDIEPHSGKYSVGQKIYAQGGITSSSAENVTGEYTELEVEKINDEGQVLSLSISKPGKYITPPESPVEIMNEEGKIIKAAIEFDYSAESSAAERDLTFVEGESTTTRLGIAYPLPLAVKKGEFTLSKQIIYLDKAYASESLDGDTCQITFDYSPVNGIPLLPPNSIDPQSTYNEAVKIIDQKFLEFEKRIKNLENRNY